MKRLFLILLMAGFTACLSAQPAKRRVTTSNAVAKKGTAEQKTNTDRAALMFPVKQSMPEVFFIIGVSSLFVARPIIGPPTK